MSTTFAIGELARQTGTKAETIRYYEKIGLLTAPLRSAGNYRSYSETDAQRLRFVRRSRELGFSIDQIRELMAFSSHGEADCSTVDNVVRSHVEDIEGKIRDLQALRGELSRMISRCPGGSIAGCRILEALDALPSHLDVPTGASRG
jgi:Cu(I)-responsive transcriptional regulator